MDNTMMIKGLHEAECLLTDRVPARYRGKALHAVVAAQERLKKEPRKPDDAGDGKHRCGCCGYPLKEFGKIVRDHYCGMCGTVVDWDE
jgi:hypothetical protein